MAFRYYYADPTGNITLLAPLPSAETSLPEYAARLMALEPSAEQVGFLSAGSGDADITLQMAGGEFCGNASLSAAAVFCLWHPESSEETRRVLVRVSGAAQPVPVLIRQTAPASYEGTVSMPSPLSVADRSFTTDDRFYLLTAVQFEGITHLISPLPMEKQLAEAAIRQWCRELGADALGIIQLDLSSRTLTPLVYVRESETLFWESSCASGTAAAGACLRQKFGPGSWEFAEPAGTLKIDAPPDGGLYLTGHVRIEERQADAAKQC